MMTNQRKQFEDFYNQEYKVDEDARFKYRTSSVEEIAFEAWQASQADQAEGVKELEARATKYAFENGVMALRLGSSENKLAIAVEALHFIAILSGNPKGERRYDLIWEKSNEALKLIEARE